MEATINRTRITLCRGDITRQQVDAIVNAANSALRGGGGVDGAIHRAGGSAIMEECTRIRQLEGGCQPGHAVITGAGNLKTKYVIHAVGPIYRDGRADEPNILRRAYDSSLKLAGEHQLTSIALPSISTGAYGFPLHQAAPIAIAAAVEACATDTTLREIRFVLFDQFHFEAFSEALAKLQ